MTGYQSCSSFVSAGLNVSYSSSVLGDEHIALVSIKRSAVTPKISPSAEPQPFLPSLAPAPLMPFTNATVPKLSGAIHLLKYHRNKGLPKQCHLCLAKSIPSVLGANDAEFPEYDYCGKLPNYHAFRAPFSFS